MLHGPPVLPVTLVPGTSGRPESDESAACTSDAFALEAIGPVFWPLKVK